MKKFVYTSLFWLDETLEFIFYVEQRTSPYNNHRGRVLPHGLILAQTVQ